MSLIECAHCHERAEARAMYNCPDCGGMICADCENGRECPEQSAQME